MSTTPQTNLPDQTQARLKGKKIVSACSSLQNFSIGFEDNLGLCIDAVNTEDGCAIQAQLVDGDKLPTEADAVCSVDWTWIKSSAPRNIAISEQSIKFDLDPVGPLVVAVALWQGKPFLSFQPFRPSSQKR